MTIKIGWNLDWYNFAGEFLAISLCNKKYLMKSFKRSELKNNYARAYNFKIPGYYH